MQEFKLFKDLSSRSKFHSCILSSFSFDYHFFDSQIRRQLHSKGIYNILLLCDAHQLDDSFGKLSFGAQHLLNDYTITPIVSKSVFHPKVSLFFGENEVMMHLGSGNLTAGGLGKNHELFSTLSASSLDDPQFPIIRAGADYLTSFFQGKTGFVQTQLQWIKNECKVLNSFGTPSYGLTAEVGEDRQVSYLFNGQQTIYQQLLDKIGGERMKKITVVSPFYDNDGTLLSRLKEDFTEAQIHLFVQPGKTVLPTEYDWEERFKFFNFDTSERGIEMFNDSHRFNHSKLFIFESEYATWFLQGSPNATAAAFGLNHHFVNDESALLYRFEKSAIIPDLGIADAAEIDWREVGNSTLFPAPESNQARRTHARIEITGADKNYSDLHFTLSKPLALGQIPVFLDASGNRIEGIMPALEEKKDIRIKLAKFPVLKRAVVLYIEAGGEKISRLAFINEVEYLWKCNPDKENRKTQKLLADLQLGNITEFDMVAHLTTIIREQSSDESNSRALSHRSHSSSSNKELDITYEEAKALAESEPEEEHMFASAKHFMDVFALILKQLKLGRDDKDIDQEEEGSKSDGGDFETTETRIYQEVKIFKKEEDLERTRVRLINGFKKYLKYLEQTVQQEEYEITSSELCYFWLLYAQLLLITNKKYFVKQEEGEPIESVIIPLDGKTKDHDSFHSISLGMMGYFLLLLNKFPFRKYADEYQANELTRYREQCAALIYLGLLFHQQVREERTEWYALLWKNAESVLPRFEKKTIVDFYDTIKEELNFDQTPDSTTINELSISCKKIEQELSLDISTRKFIKIKEFGLCKIVKKIPRDAPTKSLKVSFPGVDYDENKGDFLYHRIYNLSQEKFFPSTHSK